MKLIAAVDLARDPGLHQEIAEALKSDGLVCFPLESNYRLAASLASVDAVTRLMQSKRRSGHHPALILVPDARALQQVVQAVPPLARRLIETFWPGPLTLLLDLKPDLPVKIHKMLTRATGKVGVRCPSSPGAARLLRDFGGPLLVSSANLERKGGAQSVAQVRKNFTRVVDLFVDAGDLQPGETSTLVEVTTEGWTLVREGAISREAIEKIVR